MSSSLSKFEKVAEVLARVAKDTTVPRNIRRAASEAREILLQGKDDVGTRAAKAVMILDEISNDPNMPVHARTTIWNVVSVLETVRE